MDIMESITKSGFTALLESASAIMAKNRQRLCELDGEMGDGDLGLTMSKAFPAAAAEARQSDTNDLGKLMMRCGMKMNSAAPSSMGTLMASGFISAGKVCAGKTELNAGDFAAFLTAFADGVAKRGKASPGDRTVLDALHPAAEAALAAASVGKSLPDTALAAYEGAKAGLEATRNMKPKFGKAAVFADKSQGRIDQGALAGVLMLEAMYSCICPDSVGV